MGRDETTSSRGRAGDDGPPSEGGPGRGRRRLVIALGLYAALTAVFFATTAPERLVGHTPYNHFALLADAWLHGRLDLGGPPPDYTGFNDFAVHEGRYYVSFPPFPAVLLVPFVAIAGSPERVRDGQVFVWLAAIAPAVLFLALEELSRVGRSARSEAQNVALAALFGLGTVYWFSAVQGTVWFAAHVVGTALACVYLYASIGAARPLLAGIALGLGFATRTPLGFAFPLFLLEALRVPDAPQARMRRLATFAAPAAAVVAVLLWHNGARFGDAFEFGHRMLAVAWKARIDRWGLFSYHYLPRNLAVVLTSLPWTGTPGVPFQINAHGLALWFTSPFFLLALWPKKTSPTFWALALTAACVAAPSLLYQNSGWIQFGYRFSNDFSPFLMALVAVGARPLKAGFSAMAAWAVAVNAFGAVSFQRAGWEKFYFVERTQKVLHQPD